MANHDLIFQAGLEQNARVLALARLTGLGRDAIVGKLYRLWAWAARNCECGLAATTLDWIDEFTHQEGFGSALVQAGLIETDLSGQIAFGSQVCRSARLLPGKASLRRARKSKARAEEAQLIPPSLANPKFVELWELWRQHRKERAAPLTPTAILNQLEFLAEMGLERACACLQHSLRCGYQGLFEPRGEHVRKLDEKRDDTEQRRMEDVLRGQREQQERARAQVDRVRRERVEKNGHS